MHRSTFAFADACGLAIELGHERLRIDSLRQGVAVTTMRAGNVVRIAKVRAHTRGDRLFPTIHVNGACDLPLQKKLLNAFIELPHQRHAAVDPFQLLRAVGVSHPRFSSLPLG